MPRKFSRAFRLYIPGVFFRRGLSSTSATDNGKLVLAAILPADLSRSNFFSVSTIRRVKKEKRTWQNRLPAFLSDRHRVTDPPRSFLQRAASNFNEFSFLPVNDITRYMEKKKGFIRTALSQLRESIYHAIQ